MCGRQLKRSGPIRQSDIECEKGATSDWPITDDFAAGQRQIFREPLTAMGLTCDFPIVGHPTIDRHPFRIPAVLEEMWWSLGIHYGFDSLPSQERVLAVYEIHYSKKTSL